MLRYLLSKLPNPKLPPWYCMLAAHYSSGLLLAFCSNSLAGDYRMYCGFEQLLSVRHFWNSCERTSHRLCWNTLPHPLCVCSVCWCDYLPSAEKFTHRYPHWTWEVILPCSKCCTEVHLRDERMLMFQNYSLMIHSIMRIAYCMMIYPIHVDYFICSLWQYYWHWNYILLRSWLSIETKIMCIDLIIVDVLLIYFELVCLGNLTSENPMV